MQAVNRLRRNTERGVVAEGDVGHSDIVVNRFGQRDDVQPFLQQMIGVFLRSAAAEADQRVKMMFLIRFDDGVGHVERFAANRHPVRLVAARA